MNLINRSKIRAGRRLALRYFNKNTPCGDRNTHTSSGRNVIKDKKGDIFSFIIIISTLDIDSSDSCLIAMLNRLTRLEQACACP